MKEKQKNTISTLLLLVGAIFILVAGSIFVTTAWQYLPKFVKQIFLLVASAGLFAGAHKASRNEKLEKVERVLFYLGVAFIGFFVVALLGGLTTDIEVNALKMLIVNILMTVPVIIKLIIEKNGFEYVVLSVLVNAVLISTSVACQLNFSGYVLLFAGYVVAQAIMDYYVQSSNIQSDSFVLSVGIVYLIHVIFYMVVISWYTIFIMDSMMIPTITVFALVAATGISWKIRKHIAIRVCNSVLVMWSVLVTILNMVESIGIEWDVMSIWLAVVCLNSLIILWLRRKEMIWVQAGTAMIIPYIQLALYCLDAWDFWDGVDKEWNTTYYAFSFVFAGMFLALHVAEDGLKQIAVTWKNSRKIKFAVLQMITGVIMWLASKNSDSFGMVFFLLGVTTMLSCASFVKEGIIKRLFKMFASFACINALMCQSFVELPTNYVVEWNCFLIVMGIVLFRFIWYDEKREFSILYFVTICVLLAVLLLHNLVSGGIGNVLILGVTGIVMLIVAALMNNKKYVVASSVMLVILVLYLTREFWLSVAWWVYLFAAGVILVLLAVKKEKEQ